MGGESGPLYGPSSGGLLQNLPTLVRVASNHTLQDTMVTIKRNPRSRKRWHQQLDTFRAEAVTVSEFNHLEDLMDLEEFSQARPQSCCGRIWSVISYLLRWSAKIVFLLAGVFIWWAYGVDKIIPSSPMLLWIADGALAVDNEAEDLEPSSDGDESGPKSHGRRRPKAPLIAQYVLEGKLRFGTPRFTAANQAAVRRYIGGLLAKPDNDVRRVDQAHILDAVTAAVFIPSQVELATAVAFDNVEVRQRQAAFADTRLGSLTV